MAFEHYLIFDNLHIEHKSSQSDHQSRVGCVVQIEQHLLVQFLLGLFNLNQLPLFVHRGQGALHATIEGCLVEKL